jgi:hypothetical protein
MSEVDWQTLRSFREKIRELAEPLHLTVAGVKSAAGLIEAELIMVVLMMSTADDHLAPQELEFVNRLRRVISDKVPKPFTTNDRFEIYRVYLSEYPSSIITIDCLPATVRGLMEHDLRNQTQFAEKASQLFIEFTRVVKDLDGHLFHTEDMVFQNFEALLQENIELHKQAIKQIRKDEPDLPTANA